MDLEKYGLRPQRPEVIDSSMLRDFADCPSMFYLRHVLGLRRKIRDLTREAPMDWGTLWHKVQEVWGRTQNPTQALQVIDDEWPNSILVESDRHGRSPERMKEIFIDYIKEFAIQDLTDFEVLRHEQFFDVFDPELGLRWCGRIDRVERRKRTRRIQIRDYKTTSAMGGDWFDQHEFGFQLPGYIWGGNRMSTEPIDEVMVDVLYTLKASHQFFRRTFRITPERIAEWTHNIKMYLNDLNYHLDNFLEAPDMWKKNWNECIRYGRCAYTDVHFLPPSGDTRLRVLGSDYVEDRWFPLQQLEEVNG